MKKIKVDILLTVTFLTILIIFTNKLDLRTGNELFSISDSKHDDHGAGKIKYPTDLESKKGLYDITHFKVNSEKEKYNFVYTLSNIDDGFNGKLGFSNTIIDTYISTSDTGLTTTLNYGASVTFNENYPWTYHIRISPDESYVEVLTDKKDRKTERLKSDISIEDKTIKISVPKDEIKDNLKTAKYYVFTGGYDIFGSDTYREVASKESQWNFSGGIDSLYQPNILDVASPVQEKMLNYFTPPMYAILTPVFNQNLQLILKKEWIILFILIFTAFKTHTIKTKIKSLNKTKQDE